MAEIQIHMVLLPKYFRNMVIFPRAKINIGLRISEKRPDSYHNLQTIFYPVSLCDALEFVVPAEPLDNDILEVTGLASDSMVKDNIVIKAVKKLRNRADIPFLKLHLHKAIPAGAGLGGGSSDAANILRCLNKHYNLGIGPWELKAISLSLGSDCPFFLDNSPAYAEGRGEILMPVSPLPDGFYLIVVKPDINVDTKAAYQECRPSKVDSKLREHWGRDIGKWRDLIVNDFEQSIFPEYPEIGFLKESLYELGALYSSMSGSGSAVYGIFREKPVISDLLKDRVIYSGNL